MKCLAISCNHNTRSHKCKFYRFPKRSKTDLMMWRKISRRRPDHAFDRLCSCHFKDGNKMNEPTLAITEESSFSEKDCSPEKTSQNEIGSSSLGDKRDLMALSTMVNIGPVIRVTCEDNNLFLEAVNTETGSSKLADSLLNDPQLLLIDQVSLPSEPDTNSTLFEAAPVTSTRIRKRIQAASEQASVSKNISELTTGNSLTEVSTFSRNVSDSDMKRWQIEMKKLCKERADFAVEKNRFVTERRLWEREKKALEQEKVRLLAENLILKEKIEKMTADGKLAPWNLWERIRNKDTLVNFYTNLPNAQIFDILYEVFDDIELKYYYGWKVEKIDRRNQLLLTLMKLRLNLPVQDLATRFHCSYTTITNIFITWVYALHKFLFLTLMKEVPSRERNLTCLPSAFADYPNCRMIIDCTEISVAVPSKMGQQNMTYSSCKLKNTFKGCVGIAPNGVVTYVSSLFPGCYSDREITNRCGVLNIFEPGDSIMADEDFLIHDLLPPGVTLNIPPFLNGEQFTAAEKAKTESIARAKIHIERAIRRIKVFHILDFIPHNFHQHATLIWQTCAALTNLRPSLIKEVEDSLSNSCKNKGLNEDDNSV